MASGAPALSAGRIGRAHGLDGSFYVTRPRPASLVAGGVLIVDGEPRTVVRRAGTDAKPIVRLEGCDSREAADALRGRDLMIPRDQLPQLGPDEYWASDLEGCEVVGDGRRIGEVVRMLELPSCEALEVAPQDGGPVLLVPLVRDAIVSVDIAARRVEIRPAFLGAD